MGSTTVDSATIDKYHSSGWMNRTKTKKAVEFKEVTSAPPKQTQPAQIDWERRLPSYTLTEEDRDFVLKHAEQRSASNRAAGVRDQAVANNNNNIVEIQGLAGEVAFARIMGLPLPKSNALRSRTKGQDHKGDFTLKSGKTIDVKTPINPKPWTKLMVFKNATVQNSPNFFGLMLGTFDGPGKYVFRGAIKAQDIINKERLKPIMQPISEKRKAQLRKLKLPMPKQYPNSYQATRTELIHPTDFIAKHT